MTLNEAYERGEHDSRSVALYKFIAKMDYEQGGDSLCLKSGGDGDNGEQLMLLLDCWFAEADAAMTGGGSSQKQTRFPTNTRVVIATTWTDATTTALCLDAASGSTSADNVDYVKCKRSKRKDYR
jgi:hypothetical protein